MHLIIWHIITVVVVVNGMVYENDHRQEESRDAAYVRFIWHRKRLEGVVMMVEC